MSSYIRVGLRVAMLFVLVGVVTTLAAPKRASAFSLCSECLLDCFHNGGPDQGYDSCLDECTAQGKCPN
jgi:hypothetical protein